MRVVAATLAVLAAPPAFATCETFTSLEESDGALAGATCSTYLSEAGTSSISCYWEFPFRDADALTFSDEIWDALPSCRKGDLLEADQRVNHPDSYDLREWQTLKGTYALSVKDKGGLNRTLVFLRFEPR